VSLLKHTRATTDMFQNPYQRCQYDLVTHPDGNVWLGSFSGDSELHYVSCIGRSLALHGPAARFHRFRISLGNSGYTPAVTQLCDEYFLKHGMVVHQVPWVAWLKKWSANMPRLLQIQRATRAFLARWHRLRDARVVFAMGMVSPGCVFASLPAEMVAQVYAWVV
jgi:hypothetical protein